MRLIDDKPPGWGQALDFGAIAVKRRRQANPLVWGAWLGLFGAAVGTIAAFAGQLHPSQTVFGFGMGGLFWGSIAARIWNALGRRRA